MTDKQIERKKQREKFHQTATLSLTQLNFSSASVLRVGSSNSEFSLSPPAVYMCLCVFVFRGSVKLKKQERLLRQQVCISHTHVTCKKKKTQIGLFFFGLVNRHRLSGCDRERENRRLVSVSRDIMVIYSLLTSTLCCRAFIELSATFRPQGRLVGMHGEWRRKGKKN